MKGSFVQRNFSSGFAIAAQQIRAEAAGDEKRRVASGRRPIACARPPPGLLPWGGPARKGKVAVAGAAEEAAARET